MKTVDTNEKKAILDGLIELFEQNRRWLLHLPREGGNPNEERAISATIPFWSEWNTPSKNPDWELAAENMRRQRRRSS